MPVINELPETREVSPVAAFAIALLVALQLALQTVNFALIDLIRQPASTVPLSP